MAHAHGVACGPHNFATQAQATAFVQAMLARYQPGDRVSDDDAIALAGLLERHPRYDEKVGVGVDHFEVAAVMYGAKGFYIVRADGSRTDFSYKRCVSGNEPSHGSRVRAALRRVVNPDIFTAREAFFLANADADGRAPCAITGELITREQGHIDHLPPKTFEVILDAFLCAHELRIDDVRLTPSRDNQWGREIADARLRDAFREFHRRMANLEFIKAEINLAQAQANRIVTGRVNLCESF
jgi:hypothetical protein